MITSFTRNFLLLPDELPAGDSPHPGEIFHLEGFPASRRICNLNGGNETGQDTDTTILTINVSNSIRGRTFSLCFVWRSDENDDNE